MAAPSDVTIKDLSGAWVLNKTLSDDTDAVLALQGIGWLTRKAISIATITLHIKQYNDKDGATHIDIEQVATGGIRTTELRTLDWVERSHKDSVFGSLTGKSRWKTHDAIEDEYLKDGWLGGDEEKGGPAGEFLIESFVDQQEKGWQGTQIWGFAIVDGQRYYTRRVRITKGDKVLKIRMVYNYQGKE